MKYTPELLDEMARLAKATGGQHSYTKVAEIMGLESRNCVASALRTYGYLPKSARQTQAETALRPAELTPPHLITLPNGRRWNVKTREIERD